MMLEYFKFQGKCTEIGLGKLKSSFMYVIIHQFDNSDKLAKLRLIINLARKSFQQFGIFAKYFSLDESMVPYFGNHSFKMFI